MKLADEISDKLKNELEHSPARLYLIRWIKWKAGSVAWAADPLPAVIVEWLQKHGVSVTSQLAEGESADYVISLEDPRYQRDLSKTRIREIVHHLKPDGLFVFSVHNTLGLTYFNGTSEPFAGKPFSGLTGYAEKTKVPGLMLGSLKESLEFAGVSSYNFYYPMPDIVFPTEIYSDYFLPGPGSLKGNAKNYRSPGYEMFDIGLVYDHIIQEKLFPEFASSYLILGRKEQ
jgi:SAM-dependent methyltransferase